MSYYKEMMLIRLSEACEPHEWKYIDAAFDGDIEAAGLLTVALSNDKRGAVAVAMWQCGVQR